MRRTAPALAAAALLVACTVEVDGAPCSAPGTTVECPGGQACGNDRRCSARALACASSRCTPGVGGDCLADPVGLATGTSHARRCSDADAVCGAWFVESCADRGLACGARSGEAICECPAYPGAVLAVGPDGTRAGERPFPTGAPSPPACAFRTLTDALARAAELRAARPAEDVAVAARGAADGGPVTFSAAAGERFPITVGTGIRLHSDPLESPESHEILFDAEADATAVVALRARSALSGFTIRNGDRGRAAAGIEIACGGIGDPILVASVVVEARSAGGARLEHGFRGVEACAATLDRVQVRDASASGILWNPGAASAQLLVQRSLVTGCDTGIDVRSGTLYAEADRIADNARFGISAAWPGAAPIVGIGASRIVHNGDTGVVLTTASRIGLHGNTIFANRSSTRWGGIWVPSGIERRGGGVLLGGLPSGGFEMTANRVYANEGDQVVVLGTGVGVGAYSWSFDPGTVCVIPAGSRRPARLFTNVIGCFDPAPPGTTVIPGSLDVREFPYRGIVSIDAAVTASYQWWFGPGEPSLDLPNSYERGGSCTPADAADDFTPPIASCTSEDPPPNLPYEL